MPTYPTWVALDLMSYPAGRAACPAARVGRLDPPGAACVGSPEKPRPPGRVPPVRPALLTATQDGNHRVPRPPRRHGRKQIPAAQPGPGGGCMCSSWRLAMIPDDPSLEESCGETRSRCAGGPPWSRGSAAGPASDTLSPAGWPRWGPACSCTTTLRMTGTSPGARTPAEPGPCSPGCGPPWPAPEPGSTTSSSTWRRRCSRPAHPGGCRSLRATWTSWSATTLAAAATGRSARWTPACSTRHWAVNARSAILLAQAFAVRHDGRPGGRVIFMTSGQDLGPMPGEVAYAASKGALASVTKTLADQLG